MKSFLYNIKVPDFEILKDVYLNLVGDHIVFSLVYSLNTARVLALFQPYRGRKIPLFIPTYYGIRNRIFPS
jgi:hypothetical protein